MIDNALDQRITAWIEDNKQWILDNWMALARIPSVQGTPAENAPYGVECAQALQAAADLYAAQGLTTRLEKARGYALAEFGAGETCIGLFGHSDVVPTGDGWLYTQPFDPVIQNGMLIGRGVADNKNGAIPRNRTANISIFYENLNYFLPNLKSRPRPHEIEVRL